MLSFLRDAMVMLSLCNDKTLTKRVLNITQKIKNSANMIIPNAKAMR